MPGATCARPPARLACPAAAPRVDTAALLCLPWRAGQVFTLGASVTRGIGTVDRKNSYANRLFEYISHVFPHKCARAGPPPACPPAQPPACARSAAARAARGCRLHRRCRSRSRRLLALSTACLL